MGFIVSALFFYIRSRERAKYEPVLHRRVVFAFVIRKHLNNNNNNKQLLDVVEHDIINYQNRSLCYLPKPSASADNTDTRF